VQRAFQLRFHILQGRTGFSATTCGFYLNKPPYFNVFSWKRTIICFQKPGLTRSLVHVSLRMVRYKTVNTLIKVHIEVIASPLQDDF
jgi:hypothetical protein